MSNWTQSDFAQFYSPKKARVPKGHAMEGQSFSYGWNYFAYGSRRSIDGNTEAQGYATNFQWVTGLVDRNIYTPGNKTLIVGCGIGATIYTVKSQYPNASIWGTDISSYIHSIKDTDSPAGFDTSLILNVDITAVDALDQLKPHIGGNGKVGVVVCELVTETIPSADLSAWFTACENLITNTGIVAHIVVSNKDATQKPSGWPVEWQWKTVAEWGALAPTHYFIDASEPSIAYVPV